MVILSREELNAIINNKQFKAKAKLALLELGKNHDLAHFKGLLNRFDGIPMSHFHDLLESIRSE